jgi:hypothetical protein
MEQYLNLNAQPKAIEDKLFGGFRDASEMHQDLYYHERRLQIKKGEPTFLVLNFDNDRGIIIYYFNNKKLIGFINHEYSLGTDVYTTVGCVTDKPIELEDAVAMIETIGDEATNAPEYVAYG